MQSAESCLGGEGVLGEQPMEEIKKMRVIEAEKGWLRQQQRPRVPLAVVDFRG